MKYDDLVKKVALAAGCSPETARDVMFALPDALLTMEEGDSVRTQLGVLRMARRKGRTVKVPGTDKTAEVLEHLEVRMRPGVRLKKKG
jgi:nucleoid DNA-binding protein